MLHVDTLCGADHCTWLAMFIPLMPGPMVPGQWHAVPSHAAVVPVQDCLTWWSSPGHWTQRLGSGSHYTSHIVVSREKQRHVGLIRL